MGRNTITRRGFIRGSGGAALLTMLPAAVLAAREGGSTVRIPLATGLDAITRGEFTVETWFRTTDPGRHILLGNFSTACKGVLNLELHTDNRVRVVLQGPDGRSTDLNVSAVPLGINTRDGRWHHLAAVRSEGWINLWLDGYKAGWKPDGTATHPRGAVKAAVSDRIFMLKKESVRLAEGVRAPGGVRDPAKVEFGVMSDLHLGIINWKWPGSGYVEYGFMEQFLAEMKSANADFIIQLGDFCKRSDGGQRLLDLWQSFDGQVHNVLGNHERDGGSTFEQVAKWWGMPGRYYTFDCGRVRGIILDANEPGGGGGGYAAYIGPEQREWLKMQLKGTDRPVIVFVHQPIENGLRNGDEVRAIIDTAESERPGTVLAVMGGHNHMDYALTINTIPYIQVNSASYHWYPRFGPVRYAGPLWGRVRVDFARGEIRIKGRESGWLKENPWELGGTDGEFALEGRDLYIGSDTRLDATRLVGDLDNVRLWQGALPDDQITALAKGVPPERMMPADARIMAEYRFESSGGRTLRAGDTLQGAVDDSACFAGGPFNAVADAGGRAQIIADVPPPLRDGPQSRLAASFKVNH